MELTVVGNFTISSSNFWNDPYWLPGGRGERKKGGSSVSIALNLTIETYGHSGISWSSDSGLTFLIWEVKGLDCQPQPYLSCIHHCCTWMFFWLWEDVTLRHHTLFHPGGLFGKIVLITLSWRRRDIWREIKHSSWVRWSSHPVPHVTNPNTNSSLQRKKKLRQEINRLLRL